MMEAERDMGHSGRWETGRSRIWPRAEWEQAFGAPYTAPTALCLRRGDDAPFVPPARDMEASVFRHRAPEGVYEDTVGGRRLPRQELRLTAPARWRIGGRGFRLLRNAEMFPGCADAYLLAIPGGTPAYNWYPTHESRYLQIVFAGLRRGPGGRRGAFHRAGGGGSVRRVRGFALLRGEHARGASPGL